MHDVTRFGFAGNTTGRTSSMGRCLVGSTVRDMTVFASCRCQTRAARLLLPVAPCMGVIVVVGFRYITIAVAHAECALALVSVPQQPKEAGDGCQFGQGPHAGGEHNGGSRVCSFSQRSLPRTHARVWSPGCGQQTDCCARYYIPFDGRLVGTRSTCTVSLRRCPQGCKMRFGACWTTSLKNQLRS